MTDKSNNLVHKRWLPLLQDFRECKALSWGSAVLAYTLVGLQQQSRDQHQDKKSPKYLVEHAAIVHQEVLPKGHTETSLTPTLSLTELHMVLQPVQFDQVVLHTPADTVVLHTLKHCLSAFKPVTELKLYTAI
ncbi:hypothetical protein Ahy_A09g044289 [Arachis hypogaea]|uniref:Aminotransferase-like plant mobile domain-containing protein n=1 Tax=Arachis hypogaea TaxID=3818 RepID=A0A445BJT6_ARAHY|nr:hypothetical protein Ahy_A09g044289 [Arachis hypogaea]